MAGTSVRLMAAATKAVLTVLTAPPVAAQSAALFTAIDTPPPTGPLDEITLRSRVVTVDLGQLDHAQGTVEEAPLSCGVEEPHSETDHQH